MLHAEFSEYVIVNLWPRDSIGVTFAPDIRNMFHLSFLSCRYYFHMKGYKIRVPFPQGIDDDNDEEEDERSEVQSRASSRLKSQR
jgi:hypothetical protein